MHFHSDEKYKSYTENNQPYKIDPYWHPISNTEGTIEICGA